MPKKLNRGLNPVWFINIHSVAKHQKIERGPFGEKNWKKSQCWKKPKGGPSVLTSNQLSRSILQKHFVVCKSILPLVSPQFFCRPWISSFLADMQKFSIVQSFLQVVFRGLSLIFIRFDCDNVCLIYPTVHRIHRHLNHLSANQIPRLLSSLIRAVLRFPAFLLHRVVKMKLQQQAAVFSSLQG